MESHKSGFVSIVGRPNAGKSTLLNRLTGEKISIVTDRPQTTRQVIRGILSRPEGQIVFLDTPGIHKPIHRMNEHMMKSVRSSLADVDLLLLIVDATTSFGRGDDFAVGLIKEIRTPAFLLLNKIDAVKKSRLLPLIDRYTKLASFEEVLPISALSGDNVDALVQLILKHLPEGPPYYPTDQLSDQHERTIAAEIVREKLILATHDELPFSTAVLIERFEESDGIDRIYASVLVERESQKAIVIGKGGQLLKEVGIAARKELETFLGKKVHLELHVKVKGHWRDDEGTLKSLGLSE